MLRCTHIAPIAALLLGSCIAEDGTAPTSPLKQRDDVLHSDATADPLAPLARAVAIALADEKVRGSLLAEFRDSPYTRHRLNVQSYLSSNGIPLGDAIEMAIARPASTLLPSHQPLEISMSTAFDRATWTAGMPVVVAASSLPLKERLEQGYVIAFDSQGRSHTVRLTERFAQPVIFIGPAEVDFESEVERARRNEPTSRQTIGTMMQAFSEECDPDTAIIPCDDPPASDPPRLGPAVHVGVSCSNANFRPSTASEDLDKDNIRDVCEARFAAAFTPVLVFHADEPYKGREPYWIVDQVDYGWTTILYMLSYYYDGGLVSHDGDSEFIRVKIKPTNSNGGWAVAWVTLSAHWGACCGGDWTAHRNGQEMEYNVNDQLLIYVSKDHHANYESDQRCDSRAFDNCSFYGFREFVPFVSNANVGSAAYPFDIDTGLSNSSFGKDCARSRVSPSAHPHQGTECFFDTNSRSTFSGWSLNQGTTHYRDILYAFGFIEGTSY